MFYIYKFSLNIILNFIVCVLNIFLKRENNIVIFGSWMGKTFSDNSRYLFQYMHKYTDKKVIFVTRNSDILKELNDIGYKAYKIHSFRSYYYHLKAGVHVVCNVPFKTKQYKGDILGELSYGAKKIQLWHGIPLKGIGRNAKNSEYVFDNKLINKILVFAKSNTFFNSFVKVSGGWNNYLMLATSKQIGNIFSDAFNLPEKNIVISSYPRNCECLELISDEEVILRRIKESNKKILLYVPTFRETSVSIDIPIENKAFRKYLKKNDIIWIQKKHLADKNTYSEQNDDVETIMLPSTFDLNVLISKIDILITDYSSISFDCIFFHKPVQYYVPDLEHYVNEERGFSLSFDDYTAGWISKNLCELEQNISNQINNCEALDDITRKVNQVKNKVYDNDKASYSSIVQDLFY
ncbi:CDP-glycerol glycerophosphotransferase family protein [Enterococcus innesii]|uniref:CDP-glycerol glycerophosphotransferase family protein n=1 Tax=Enterococcus innesii TaxID=2839759 RepID=UPI003B5A7C0E